QERRVEEAVERVVADEEQLAVVRYAVQTQEDRAAVEPHRLEELVRPAQLAIAGHLRPSAAGWLSGRHRARPWPPRSWAGRPRPRRARGGRCSPAPRGCARSGPGGLVR